MPVKIQSVERALDILEHVADSDELGVNDLARSLESDPSTISRQLAFLADRGYVSRVPSSGKYRLGIQVLALARRFSVHEHLTALALQAMSDLRDATGQSVALFVLDGSHRLCLEQVSGHSPLLRIYQVGEVQSLWPLGSVGRALIAFLEEPQRAELVKMSVEHGYDAAELSAELEHVRERGFAFTQGERVGGSAGISAPIRSMNRFGAVINLGAAASSLPPEDLPEISSLVIQAADSVSEALDDRQRS